MEPVTRTLIKHKWMFIYILFITLVAVIWLLITRSDTITDIFLSNSFMSITMLFASFIAGATSEGGGAIAFPVMTLIFDIKPVDAKTFSLLIQSVGMTSAAIMIKHLKIKVIDRAIIFGALGAFGGMPIGLYFAPFIPPHIIKFLFLSVWLAFAFVFTYVNRNKSWSIINPNKTDSINYYSIILYGLAGGVISGLMGSGLDILVFSYLTLKCRVSEKVSTPTSVILMALGSLIGLFWLSINHQINQAVVNYWLVSVPVVIIGAPIGAIFISNRSKKFIKKLLIISIAIQFIGGVFIINHTYSSVAIGLVFFILGLMFFKNLERRGKATTI